MRSFALPILIVAALSTTSAMAATAPAKPVMPPDEARSRSTGAALPRP